MSKPHSLYALTIFGHTFPRPPTPRDPTPLEVAVKSYVDAQHALLGARLDQERADATVRMLLARVERLRETIDELRNDRTAS